MNIVHLSISDDQTGAALAAARLHQLMLDAGLASHLLTLVKRTDMPATEAVGWFGRHIRSRAGLYLDKLGLVGGDPRLGSFSFAWMGADISRHPKVAAADVIYVHWVNSGFLSIAALEAIVESGKAAIFLLHDMWIFTGGCHHVFECSQFEGDCYPCPYFDGAALKSRLVQHRQRSKRSLFASGRAVAIVAPSSEIADKARRSSVLLGRSPQVIPNPLDYRLYGREGSRSRQGRSEKFQILFGAMGGKANLYKGWNYFVEAINALPDNIIDNVEVVLFGYDFAEGEPADIKARTKSHGVVAAGKMPGIYRQSDIYIFPSVQESFGQTATEAMACGVPVVGFPVGVIPDIVGHQESGYIARYKDARDLAEGIAWAFHHGDGVKLRIAAQDDAWSLLDGKRILKDHIELIDRLRCST